MAPAITGNNIAKSTCTKNDKNAQVINVNVIMDIVKKSKHSQGSMNILRDLLLVPLNPMETATIKSMPQMMATPE